MVTIWIMKKVRNKMNLLEFLKSETDIKEAIHIEEYNGQTIVYIDEIEVKDAWHKRDFCGPDYFEVILERFMSEHFGIYEETEYLDERAIEALKTIQISIDGEAKGYSSSVKYPYYKAIGKVITQEEKERI